MSADTGIRDVVTGLYVREYFDDVIARELERSRRHEIPLSVVSVVIRDFDSLAAAGEEATVSVLVEIARELGRNVRETDHLFRWEADEFLLLLFGADAAVAAVERVRAAIAEVRLPNVEEAVTASAGVALHHGAFDSADVAGLIRRADQALYKSKAEGRDRTTVESRGPDRPTSPAEVRYR